MLYRTTGLMDFIHRPAFKRRKQKNTTFRRLDLSPSSGVWDKIKPTQLGPLEGASLNHWTQLSRFSLVPYTWGWRQIQSPKRSVLLFPAFEHQTMDKVRKPNSSVQHIPSSESFQDYQDPNVRVSEVSSCLRPHGCCDRHQSPFTM
jgi:hypothetical protein